MQAVRLWPKSAELCKAERGGNSLFLSSCCCVPVCSSTAPWHGREVISYQKKVALSWTLYKQASSAQWACMQQELAGLQCGSALPPSLESWEGDGKRWSTTRPNCPRSARGVLHPGTSQFAEIWGDQRADWLQGEKKFSPPWGLWALGSCCASRWKWNKQTASRGCPSSRTAAGLAGRSPWLSNVPETCIAPTYGSNSMAGRPLCDSLPRPSSCASNVTSAKKGWF